MKTDEAPAWTPAVGAAILVSLFAVLALVAAGGWSWFAKFLESAAPAWVQAVGSIAAIVAAGKIAAWQFRATLLSEEQSRKERMQAMLEVIAALIRLLMMEIEARTAFVAQSQNEAQLRQFLKGDPFADIEFSARQIPVHDLLDPGTVRLVFDLLRLTRLTRDVNARLRDQFDEMDGIFLRAGQPYGLVLAGLTDLETRCAAAANALTLGD